ncbi:LPXTG cell wall anchor domain-containing protein [Corynebacterium sp.]|uniref:LPXTG cell wall anchor domain-containing protein n=1 Tax=Corynebacterium sp. TaxID=1720 RepID=UPI0019CB0D73|nr:LPXTG cell wall anchor domain-containing protein [Corynebacterium sp.]HHU67542.1 LPXTG cell wall anchor domain-containing protein [Corynebacterium sp.]
MFNKRIAAAVAGASLVPFAFLPTAAAGEGAEEIIKVGDQCYVEKVITEEKVVGTRTVAETGTRASDWQVGEVKGPEGWTFQQKAVGEGQDRAEHAITANIPEGTPTGEYTAEALHFSFSKNQVAETVTFKVVEENVTESSTRTERHEVPCMDETRTERGGGEGEGGDNTRGGGEGGEQGRESQVLGEGRDNFVDFKVLAQQQAVNAPAAAPAAAANTAAPAAAAPATAAQAAQQQQLANTGISGVLTILAVGLLAAAGGAALILKRRAA